MVTDYLMINIIIKKANFSNDRKERYSLTRIWNFEKPLFLFIMFNPSNADDTIDDPTIRRLIDFTEKFEYGGFKVVNLFTKISPNPKNVNISKVLKIKNLKVIKKMVNSVDEIVYAWGNKFHEPLEFKKLVPNPKCFGLNIDGSPKHPLYLSSNTKLVDFRQNKV